MKILLISPCIDLDARTPAGLIIPQLALYMIEGLTPKGHSVKIVEEEIRLLREISCKLDQLILLLKLSNKEKLEAFRMEIEKDSF